MDNNSPKQTSRESFDIKAAVEGMQATILEAKRVKSYGERNPSLGKMRTCPLCHKRRRESVIMAGGCCNTKYTETKRAWSPEQGFYQDECPMRIASAQPQMHPPRRLKKKVNGTDEFGNARVIETTEQPARQGNFERMIRRNLRARHVPVPYAKEIHELTILLQRDWEESADLNTSPLAVRLNDQMHGQVHGKASKWGHTPQRTIQQTDLPSFAEEVVMYLHKKNSRRIRRQQDISRRINRGFARAGVRP